MKKTVSYITLFFIILLSFISCKNKLDVLAPGKESISVYGILNANEPVQNIRINKVYLVEGDALASAQDANAINYGPGELLVTLERYNDASSTVKLPTTRGQSKTEIVLTETVVTTQSGTFNSTQRLWQTSDLLYKTGEYKLIVKKVGTDLIYTSQNVIVDSVKTFVSGTGGSSAMPFIYAPTNPTSYPNHGQYITAGPGLTPQSRYIDYSVLSGKATIKFFSVPNANIYSVVIRYHYRDSLSIGSGSNKYVDFNFPTVKSSKLTGSEALTVEMGSTNEFYTNLGNELSKQNVPNLVARQSLYMEYIISAGAESLSDFLQVNAPSNTIAQDKPYYTNIKNGVGIFSSRSTSSVTKDLWNSFIDKIACHPSTNPHLFLNSAGVKTTVCP